MPVRPLECLLEPLQIQNGAATKTVKPFTTTFELLGRLPQKVREGMRLLVVSRVVRKAA